MIKEQMTDLKEEASNAELPVYPGQRFISETYYPSLVYRLNNLIRSNTYYGINDVCAEWSDCMNGHVSFIDWSMANGFSRSSCYLLRLDNTKPYGPDNCKWVTRAEYMRCDKRPHCYKPV